tara:strand:- start:3252 stop:4340 length:1089 start_codon:yes stop_codon:yes gene_type:complete
MARKNNTGMFERVGYNLGMSNVTAVSTKAFEKGYDRALARKNLDISKIVQKSQEKLNKFPEGIEISKVPEDLRPELTKWLVDKKQEYNDASIIISKGSNTEGYSEAIEKQNNIEAAYLEMSNTLENVANTHKNVADRQASNSNANSMTNDEVLNFHNLYQANYGVDGLNAQIVDNKLMFTSASGDQVNANDFAGMVGTEYNFELEDTINDLLTNVENAAHKKNPYWNRNETERKIKQLARDPQAVKNYIYQNPVLIDNYISNQTGIPIEEDINGNPIGKWKEFKAGIFNKMPRVGEVVSKEDYIPTYDDFFNSNKINEDFTNGFVETVMNMFDVTYETQLQNAQGDSDENTTEGEFNNLIGG